MSKSNGDKEELLFIVPLFGLELSEIGNEFKIDRVTFLSEYKLRRLRKRFGLKYKLSDYENYSEFHKKVFGIVFKTESYAIISSSGNANVKEVELQALNRINEEIDILALSQLGCKDRYFYRKIQIAKGKLDKNIHFLKLNKNKFDTNYRIAIDYEKFQYKPDVLWRQFHKRFFYFKLLKIIRGEINVKPSWRNILYNVAVIVGQSQNTNVINQAFLFNIIALEMLFKSGTKKIGEDILDHSRFLLGWSENWVKFNYENKIKELYVKRGEYVHKGIRNKIESHDLVFSDFLLFDLLNNLINNHSVIRSKESLKIKLEKYNSGRVLGIEEKYYLPYRKILGRNVIDTEQFQKT